jgi:transforming growth factor-beta-induced protein
MLGSAINPVLDIIDTILAEAAFKALLCALQTARMVDQLKGSGPFTLFAPTDEAFAKLPAGGIQQLEKPENAAKLMRLLEGHLVKGEHNVPDLRQRQGIEAVSGAQYSIVTSGASITLGGAHILGHGIACTNGVIHVLDTVLQTA